MNATEITSLIQLGEVVLPQLLSALEALIPHAASTMPAPQSTIDTATAAIASAAPVVAQIVTASQESKNATATNPV